GKVLAAAGDGVSLREADTGKEIRRIPRGTFDNDLIAFGPDSKVLAVSNPWTITLWEIATGKRLDPPDRHEEGVDGVTFLSDGKSLASRSRDALFIWDWKTGTRDRQFEGTRFALGSLSPDGKTLAVSQPDENQMIELWETATGKKLREWKALQSY